MGFEGLRQPSLIGSHKAITRRINPACVTDDRTRPIPSVLSPQS